MTRSEWRRRYFPSAPGLPCATVAIRCSAGITVRPGSALAHSWPCARAWAASRRAGAGRGCPSGWTWVAVEGDDPVLGQQGAGKRRGSLHRPARGVGRGELVGSALAGSPLPGDTLRRGSAGIDARGVRDEGDASGILADSLRVRLNQDRFGDPGWRRGFAIGRYGGLGASDGGGIPSRRASAALSTAARERSGQRHCGHDRVAHARLEMNSHGGGIYHALQGPSRPESAGGLRRHGTRPARSYADRFGTPCFASCRSCTRDSITSDTIDPISASCMSHCVSHTSPWVPRKSVAAAARGQRGPELDQLVEGAERQAEADDDERQPPAPAQRRAPDEDLARQHRRDESLREVADPVVVIPA